MQTVESVGVGGNMNVAADLTGEQMAVVCTPLSEHTPIETEQRAPDLNERVERSTGERVDTSMDVVQQAAEGKWERGRREKQDKGPKEIVPGTRIMDKSHDKPENPTDQWSKDVELEVENSRVEECV
jgi:cytochrome c2